MIALNLAAESFFIYLTESNYLLGKSKICKDKSGDHGLVVVKLLPLTCQVTIGSGE
ncbi:hypothetical protein [Geobacter metallireducens]|uniref:hypothetical protein n=1 Tax=Geobacter metallireducens TaxID=28232 RepID=UPI0016514593|nr:hypothetical protein [Geobacter metallireducens]